MTPPDNPKACPFCGTSNGDLLIIEKDKRTSLYFVHCLGCSADGSLSKTEQRAIDAWNTRTFDPILAELVKHCKNKPKTGPLLVWSIMIDEILSRLEPETKGGQDG